MFHSDYSNYRFVDWIKLLRYMNPIAFRIPMIKQFRKKMLFYFACCCFLFVCSSEAFFICFKEKFILIIDKFGLVSYVLFMTQSAKWKPETMAAWQAKIKSVTTNKMALYLVFMDNLFQKRTGLTNPNH